MASASLRTEPTLRFVLSCHPSAHLYGPDAAGQPEQLRLCLSGIQTFTNYKNHSESADFRQAANFPIYCRRFLFTRYSKNTPEPSAIRWL